MFVTASRMNALSIPHAALASRRSRSTYTQPQSRLIILQERMHMLNIIKDKTVVGEDDWTLLRLNQDGAENETPEAVIVPAGRVIVPLAVWHAQRAVLQTRSDVGVWIASDERPEALKDDIARLPLIAVDFPKFGDGRGYSIG